jgi:hypothetical protein
MNKSVIKGRCAARCISKEFWYDETPDSPQMSREELIEGTKFIGSFMREKQERENNNGEKRK